jgi:hypothetical protein
VALAFEQGRAHDRVTLATVLAGVTPPPSRFHRAYLKVAQDLLETMERQGALRRNALGWYRRRKPGPSPSARLATCALVNARAGIHLMVEKILGVLHHPPRRHFTEPDSLRSWLGEVLTLPEKAQLAVFLG